MRLEDLDATTHCRLMSPSAQLNKEPIARVLSQILPETGLCSKSAVAPESTSFTLPEYYRQHLAAKAKWMRTALHWRRDASTDTYPRRL
jgi:hypothetical protein